MVAHPDHPVPGSCRPAEVGVRRRCPEAHGPGRGPESGSWAHLQGTLPALPAPLAQPPFAGNTVMKRYMSGKENVIHYGIQVGNLKEQMTLSATARMQSPTY